MSISFVGARADWRFLPCQVPPHFSSTSRSRPRPPVNTWRLIITYLTALLSPIA